jgi:hypothetical protein
VTVLHEHGLVFGGLRRPNVMIFERKTTIERRGTIRGMLVDSDWAGKVGEARYPPKVMLQSCGLMVLRQEV